MATDITIVSRTVSVRKEHPFLIALEKAGLNDDLAQRVIESKDNNLAIKLVRLIRNGGFEPTPSQKRVRGIMGVTCSASREAITHFEVNPSRQLS